MAQESTQNRIINLDCLIVLFLDESGLDPDPKPSGWGGLATPLVTIIYFVSQLSLNMIINNY